MQKKLLLFIILLSGMAGEMWSQKQDSIPAGVYLIKDLQVVGTDRYSKNQIINFTGLRIGKSIQVPGNDINTAIKKLWKTERFSDVVIYATPVSESELNLQVELIPTPQISALSFEGVPKSKGEKFAKDFKIKDGDRITDAYKNKITNQIKGYYANKGYPDAKIQFKEQEETPLQEKLTIKINRGNRIKIAKIHIEGNEKFKDSKIRKKLKNTKQKNAIRFWKPSKYNVDKFDDDLDLVNNYLKSEGFRDAKITSSKVIRNSENEYEITLQINEGDRYFLGDVNFVGNSIYPTEYLQKVFGYQKGDPYDAVGINKKVSGSEKDDDISTLYLDSGYLFSNIQYIEKSVQNDTINVNIRINEGEQARWNNVTFEGNLETHDHVIQRSLRTLPGELFSKTDVKRSIYELAGMGMFEAAEIVPDIQPNQETNSVDINWELSEKNASQVELQGGYGGNRFIGTLGLTFNNFSLSNLFRGKWEGMIPQGDAQQLSLRAQAGSNYQNYSLTFVEPWLTGKKPTSFSVSFYYTLLRYKDTFGLNQNLDIIGGSVYFNKLLNVPDDYFRFNQGISYQKYKFENYPFNFGNIQVENGTSNNLAYFASFGRYSAGPDQIFPTGGSEFEIGLKLTPPYSLFNNKDYGNIDVLDQYKWLEYYKIKTKLYWYKEILGKLVMRAGGEFGVMSYYDKKVGLPPFERFYIGGTGLAGNRFDGREIIPLRGYQDASNFGGQPGVDITPEGGGTIYDKYIFELRYPITMNQTAKIYGLTFFEAGNAWNGFQYFKPFELKRSAGFGVRIFMQAFGLIGFDFGYGFDKPLFDNKPSGWQTHFIFGQQF